VTPEIHCDRDVLQKLLTEALPEPEESDVSNHLAICASCRREFEVLAAGREWWAEATQRLSRKTVRDQEFASSHDDDAQFTTDFAVDFLEPSDDPKALGRLGEYEIVEVIGRGGMGIVLKGFQKELHRHVAVKVLSPHLSTSGAARRRFAREAQATAAVVHPHVMAIHSVNANAKLPYLVMPYVACQSLQERLDRQGPLDVKDVLRIGMQAAWGLAAAHAQGLVHRDVKPANILLETNVDRVLLTDFGLARAVDDATLTRTGIIAGTPQYMSPEQANGDAVDHSSDLFSLGGVLYAMCTARPPFRAETTFGVLRRIREAAPRSIREINPDIPEWLERIVMKLLDKDTAARFRTAAEAATLLEQCLAHVQQPMSVALPTMSDGWQLVPEVTKTSTPSRQREYRVAVNGSVIAVITLIAFCGWMYWPGVTPVTPESNPHQIRANSESSATNTNGPTDSKEAPHWNAVDIELDGTEGLIEALEAVVNDGLEPRNVQHSVQTPMDDTVNDDLSREQQNLKEKR
jgi:eukaryotic-like serine/threonine-protein kinase